MAGSTTYQYILSLQDKMSGTLQKAGVQGSKTYDQLNAKQEKLNKSAGLFSGIIGKLAIGAGIAMIGKKIFTAGADIEQTRVAFGVLMGDVEKGNKVLSGLLEFAKVTPFESNEVIQSGRQLLNAGIAAENLQGALKAVGDVAAGTKVPINEMAAIYAKVMNKGKMQAEELNQMSERGVPILKTLAKMYGVTTQEVLKMGEKGQLTSASMEKAFQIMTSEGGQFYDLMAKQSQTLGGQWSNLMDTISLTFMKIGEKLLPVLKPAVEWLIKGFGKIIPIMRTIRDIFRNPFVQVFSIAIVALTASIMAYYGAIKIASLATKVWTSVQAAFNAVMLINPIYLIIAGIVALIAAIAYVIYKTDGWKAQWDEVVDFMKNKIDLFANGFKLVWQGISNFFLNIVDGFVKAWKWSLNAMGKLSDEQYKKDLKAIDDNRKAREKSMNETQKALTKNVIRDVKGIDWKLKWNDSKFSDVTGKIKDKLGLNASGATGVAAGAGLETTGTIAETSKGIADGGSRPTNITINLNNLVENLSITAANAKEGTVEMERMVREAMLRVLNSANGVAYGN